MCFLSPAGKCISLDHVITIILRVDSYYSKDKFSLSILNFLLARKKQVLFIRVCWDVRDLLTLLIKSMCFFLWINLVEHWNSISDIYSYHAQRYFSLIIFVIVLWNQKQEVDQIKLLKFQKLQNSWKITNENLLLLTSTFLLQFN